MRITAAICWHDEKPEWLDRCVRSVAPLVDSIIIADGPWAGVEHEQVKSPAEQRRAILDAAMELGLGAIEIPARLWSSQAEKRTAMYQRAGRAAEYLLVIDADEQLHCTDPQRVRRVIDLADPDALNVRVMTPAVVGRLPLAPVGSAWQPRILRVSGTMTSGPYSHHTLATRRHVIACDNVDDLGELHDRGAAKVRQLNTVTIVNHVNSRDARRVCIDDDRGIIPTGHGASDLTANISE